MMAHMRLWASGETVASSPRELQRSLWHGLTGSEALELADAECTPPRLAMEPVARAHDVAIEYALRCVRALTGNDLAGALRAAAIADAALVTEQAELDRGASRELHGDRQRVVEQDEAALSVQRSQPRPAHRPERPILA